MSSINTEQPETIAALLKEVLQQGCFPAALLKSESGRNLVDLVAPGDDGKFQGRSVSTRADFATQFLNAACARYPDRVSALQVLLMIGDNRDLTLTARRDKVAELGHADSGDSFRRRKEADWLFDVAVELQIVAEGDLASFVRVEQLDLNLDRP